MKYDLIIVSFSQLSTDARTLNFARAASESGKRIAVISLQESNFSERLKKTDIFQIFVNPKKRMFLRWYIFIKKAGKLIKDLQTKTAIAADLYSLPVISKVFATKYVYDSREIYSALGPLAGQKLKQRIITEIEKYYSSILNVIYTSGKPDSEYLKQNLTNKPEYYEIYNVPYYKKPESTNLIRNKFNITDGKSILLYQGAVLPYRGIMPALEFLKNSDSYVLCIIGEGEYLTEINNKIEEYNITDKVFKTGRIDYKDLHKWTSSADIGLALFEPVTFSYELASPNKLFEYFMAGIPALATDLSPIRSIYDEFEFGALISSKMTEKEIAEGIKYIKNNYETIKENLSNASKKYCYENEIKKIIKIIE